MSRYRVVEIDGWPINPGARSSARSGGISVSVLDTAWAYREVGRFTSGHGFTSKISRRRAHALAEKLEREAP